MRELVEGLLIPLPLQGGGCPKGGWGFGIDHPLCIKLSAKNIHAEPPPQPSPLKGEGVKNNTAGSPLPL